MTFNNFPEAITTERLELSRPALAEAEAIAELANNWQVSRWLAVVPYPYTLEDAKTFIDRCQNQWMAGESRAFAIRSKNDLDFMGMVGLRKTEEQEGKITLGYWLGHPFWGKGYGFEAVEAVIQTLIDGAMEKQKPIQVQAVAVCENHGSIRILEKLGFKRLGASTCHSLAQGKDLDSLRFMLSRP